MVSCSLFFGLVYPAYGSVAAVESNTGDDDTHWLIYWLIFSLLTIVENVAWPLLKWYDPTELYCISYKENVLLYPAQSLAYLLRR